MSALAQRYQLGKQVGSGQFGTVYLATRLRTGSQRAVKVIERRNNWRRELDILTLLRHPNIVRYYDHIEEDDKVYVVMEYCAGGNLFDLVVKQGCIDEARSKRWGAQLLGALEYCQGHLVAHRDLKPENLLLDAEDNLKLADFGLAKQTEGSTGSFCGSLWYVALELFQGKPYNPMLSDAWSFGVVMSTIVLGNFPFCVKDENDLRAHMARQEIPPLQFRPADKSECSHEFKYLIGQLLAPSEERLPLHRCKYALWFQGELVHSHLEAMPPCEPESDLVQLVVDMGYDRRAVENLVRRGTASPAQSIYHLLKQRRQPVQRTESVPELRTPKRIEVNDRGRSAERLKKQSIESPPPVFRRRKRIKSIL